MAILMIRHTIRDFDAWRPVFDADARRRAQAGLRLLEFIRGDEDPNDILLMFEVPDVETGRRFVSDPVLAEKMREAGVEGVPEFFVGERVSETTLIGSGA